VNRVRLPRMYTALMHYGSAQSVSRQGQRKWSAEGSQRMLAAAISPPISNSGEKSEQQHRRNDQRKTRQRACHDSQGRQHPAGERNDQGCAVQGLRHHRGVGRIPDPVRGQDEPLRGLPRPVRDRRRAFRGRGVSGDIQGWRRVRAELPAVGRRAEVRAGSFQI
jgi:hypothetical protein